MAVKQQITTVIDIGATSIKAIAGYYENQSIKIVGAAQGPSAGIKKGTIFNLNETLDALKPVIEELEAQIGTPIKSITTSVQGQQINTVLFKSAQHAEDGIITTKELDKLYSDAYNSLLEPGYKIYHIFPQKYYIDGEPINNNPIGSAGKRIDAHLNLITAPSSYEEILVKIFSQLNIKINKTIIAPIATHEATLTQDEKEAGVMLIELGSSLTHISTFYDGALYKYTCLPIGSSAITKDVKEACSILQRQAEQLKINHGEAFGDLAPEDKFITIPGINGWENKEIACKTLAYVIEARVEEVISAVKKQLPSSNNLQIGSGIVLTGGGAQLKNIAALFKAQTQINVRLGYPITQSVESNHAKFTSKLDFATVTGLLKLALQSNNNNTFIKPIVVETKKKKSNESFLSQMKNHVSKQLSLFFEEQDGEIG